MNWWVDLLCADCIESYKAYGDDIDLCEECQKQLDELEAPKDD
jgi:hypothetical protein